MNKLHTLTPIAALLALSASGLAHASEVPTSPATTTTSAPAEGKCGEGKCGAQCASKKAPEAKCGADKKMPEGKCGEGKCGANHH